MVTIYTITYNEEVMLPFFIKHYRERFPNCRIVIFDNMSDDKTVEIASQNNCEVVTYDTGGKLSDSVFLQIKNNCWKDAETDWVLVCDCDEFLNINEQQLKHEDSLGVSIISTEGYNMIDLREDTSVLDIGNIKYGSREKNYDKKILFKKRKIIEINYQPGCHVAYPQGEVIYSEKIYMLGHVKFISLEYMIQRYKLFADRLSDENIVKQWSFHYKMGEEKIREEYFTIKANAKTKVF
jgi:glycosyltransferase involved in cell wall biosynthesis